MLVKMQNNEVAKYPYTRDELCADFPDTGFPYDLSAVDLTEFNAALVVPTEAPVVGEGEVVRELQPIFSDGQWIQQWEVVSA